MAVQGKNIPKGAKIYDFQSAITGRKGRVAVSPKAEASKFALQRGARDAVPQGRVAGLQWSGVEGIGAKMRGREGLRQLAMDVDLKNADADKQDLFLKEFERAMPTESKAIASWFQQKEADTGQKIPDAQKRQIALDVAAYLALRGSRGPNLA